MNLKNKKVLVFGLGILGGGVATTNWLLSKGAKVTVTDLKNAKDLAPSLKKIKGPVKLALGGHEDKDIKGNDIIVVNPDVSFRNPYIKLAKKLGKQVENEATLFYKNFEGPKIGVTGTRGKTTTVNWAAHFLGVPAIGNSDVNPYLKMLDQEFAIAVTELPSYLLELFSEAPNIVVITNIYRDHLNRYESFSDYAMTKANIFRRQTAKDHLILNYDDDWTESFLKESPKAQIFFTSKEELPKEANGIFWAGDSLYYQLGSKKQKVLDIKQFLKRWGEHGVYNLMAASLAAHLSGLSWSKISGQIETLPQIPFRLETVYKDKRIEIVNDTAATSPEGGIAAIKKFASPSCILLAGGTDKELDFEEWARVAKRYLKKENIFLLEGSATDKMLRSLRGVKVSESFEGLIKAATAKALTYESSVLLFSPASKSFEKFKNEYDRGEQFNKLIKKWTKPLKKRTK